MREVHILAYFYQMLKIGLIGNVGPMVSHIQQLKNIRDVQVIGKSSVGMMEEPESRFLSIPEFNRRELVEAADVLIVDKSQMLIPDLLIWAVKSSKHLYISDYPDIVTESCGELLKLAEEARTVIHIRNSLRTESLTGWLILNWQEPAYISIFESMTELPEKRTFLLKHLFFAYSLFNAYPQKIRVSGMHQSDTGFYFINIRLDYSTFSAYNLEMLIQPPGERNMKAVMPGKFLEGDLRSGKAFLNQREMVIHTPQSNSLADFLKDYGKEDFFLASNLDQYHAALDTLTDVLKKIELFTPWHSS